MNNDETLFKQAGLLTGLASAGDDLRAALKIQSAPMAATAVKKVFDAVDALRETIRREPYEPVVGEPVTIQGVVRAIGYGGSVEVAFSEKDYDYHAVDPRLVPVRPA